MNKNIAKQWIAALRSGDYLQGHGRLVAIGKGCVGFCCLGVLCNIATENGYGEWVGDHFKDERSVRNSLELSIEVRKWADMSDKSMQMLIEFNDTRGFSFQQIADYIEKNMRTL